MPDYQIGNAFGKPDIERLGIFSELSYMHGKRYNPVVSRPSYIKGANFLNTGRKIRAGTQAGYFDDEFKRLYIGEAIVRVPKKKSVGAGAALAPFIVNSVAKKHATPGDIYGTFTKSITEFSPKRVLPKYVREPPNMIGKSGKIGGPGYADSGINKYPEYKSDPYGVKLKPKQFGVNRSEPFQNTHYPDMYFETNPYFETPKVGLYLNRMRKPKRFLYSNWQPTGPAKWQGGSHAGCFNRFPAFMPCKYYSTFEANKPIIKDGGVSPPFVPTFKVPKTLFNTSVVSRSVDVFMNTNNARSYVPCYVDHLLTEKLY